MITQTLPTITGKLRITIPTRIEELKLKHLIDLQIKSDLSDLEAIHILSGTPLNELQQVKNYDELQIFNSYIFDLADSIKSLYQSRNIPHNLKFYLNNKHTLVKVKRNLSVEPAGAFMIVRDIIADEIKTHVKEYGDDNWQQHFNPSLQACSQILAHYLYCPATGMPYDEYQASLFTEQVNELLIVEALPIAKYFFLSYPNLSKRKTGFWHLQCQRLSNGRVFRSLKNSGLLIPLTH